MCSWENQRMPSRRGLSLHTTQMGCSSQCVDTVERVAGPQRGHASRSGELWLTTKGHGRNERAVLRPPARWAAAAVAPAQAFRACDCLGECTFYKDPGMQWWVFSHGHPCYALHTCTGIHYTFIHQKQQSQSNGHKSVSPPFPEPGPSPSSSSV